MDEFGPRLPLALAVAVGVALLAFLLGAGINASAVVLVGAVAAVLVAGLHGPDRSSTESPDTARQHGAAATQAAIDAIDEPILVIAAGHVDAANPAARALLGQHIVGGDVRLAIRHPAAAERLFGNSDDPEPVGLVGLGSRDQSWEMRVRSLGGERRLVHLADRTGNRATERMRVDFVANASHELRTPLASLLGFIETLRDEAGEDPGVRERFLKVMNDEARRMQRLIDDLISLSRIEAEKYRPPDQSVDLSAMLRAVRDELSATNPARGADLSLLVEPAVTVIGDRAQLSQLLHNVIGNAMKYGRAGTPVEIRLAPRDTTAELVVRDHGEGVAIDHLPRLTERFYRVDSGRSRALGGTGLGLAIVKHIVERHRGRLDIGSVVGDGTTVSVLLPLNAVMKP
ncbi:ATP-binding protein [Sphingomonas sp. Leaf10]|jgi:two-component system phosphate regulon sensor histidine kinase PhoR|uniref:ATP-binding protein n=1 Tax=Sphingomonas sp. Leaf10 TaxID=1735676 RepID=UPI0006F8C3A0|nr:ATP-binding protein [Sphingomonas sp. Leaf10]KQM38997.1 ATPase [Sphingomonas sp. Leaf10]